MNHCCKTNEPTSRPPHSHNCPINGHAYSSVKRKTLLHHIKHPWENMITEQAYYFCTDPECDVVYFGQNDTIIRTNNLRTTVWQKSTSEEANICYCFGVSKVLALTDNNIKRFVVEQTKNASCACETQNPSGRCCLSDFPK